MTSNLKWTLGGNPPEPQKWEDGKKPEKDAVEPSETHTGTDPNGRAVGPAEDHTEVKKVLNEKGQKVTPKGQRRLKK